MKIKKRKIFGNIIFIIILNSCISLYDFRDQIEKTIGIKDDNITTIYNINNYIVDGDSFTIQKLSNSSIIYYEENFNNISNEYPITPPWINSKSWLISKWKATKTENNVKNYYINYIENNIPGEFKKEIGEYLSNEGNYYSFFNSYSDIRDYDLYILIPEKKLLITITQRM